jgi:hypothetical protein
MHLLHFNMSGIIIFLLAFCIALGVGHLASVSDEGPLMMIGGPLCIAMDASLRLRNTERRWFHPHSGGSFVHIPMWLLGIVWLLLGIAYTIRGRA